MSGQLGELVISLAADMARFQSDMGKAQKVANDTMQRVAGDVNRGVSSIERSMSAVGSSLAGAFSVAAVTAFTHELIQAGLAAEKLQMQFKASSGSGAAAARELSYIRDISNKLGLDFQAAATAYGKWLASTRNTSIEGASAQKVFEGVSEAVTALGLSSEEAQGVFLALGQMMSKGKVSAEELTGQLGERLPGALKLAADSLGLTTAELMQQMQQGKIMSADLLPKLADQLHKTYGQTAEEASEKGQAAINRMNNALRDTKTVLAENVRPAFVSLASGAVESINAIIHKIGENKIIMHGWLREFGAMMDGGTMGSNWLTGKGRAEIRAAMDAEAQMTVYSLGEWDRKFGGGSSQVTGDSPALKAANAQRAAAEKAAAAKADNEKAAKAAAAAEEKLRQEYNKGVQSYNRLVDTYNGALPTLSDTEKAIAKIREEVANLSKEHPEQRADAERLGKKIEDQLRMAEARKLENAEMRESIRLMEEMGKDVSFEGLGKGLQPMGGFLTYGDKKPVASLLGGADFGAPKFDLLGPSESGFSQELTDTQSHKAEMLEIEKRYSSEILSMKMGVAEQSLAILERAASEGSAIAIGALAAQKALAVAQIIMNTNAAASAALLPPPVGLGPVAGMALAGEIKAMGYMNAAMTGAVAIMDIAGKRESGGPVRAGETYLVGERGPELMTAARDGYITPNHALGGATYAPVFNIDARGSNVTRGEIEAIANRAADRGKAEILDSMRRGGQFSSAPRR